MIRFSLTDATGQKYLGSILINSLNIVSICPMREFNGNGAVIYTNESGPENRYFVSDNFDLVAIAVNAMSICDLTHGKI